MILRFADNELDLDRVELRHDGEPYPIEPQVFDVLVHLATNRGRVVTKEELLDQVWGDRFVSESALTTRIKSARRAVGDDGTTQGVIRTVHGRGYEFVAEIHEVENRQETTTNPSGDLPVAVGRLVGREHDLDHLVTAVTDHRLVSLVGAGGVGKTSLGYELCRAVDGRFPDGIWPVELVQVTPADDVAGAVATALDLQSQHGRSMADTIVEVFRPREALIFLDNCEHVIESVSHLVELLLQRAPDVTIVTSSREALMVAGEHLWPVQPLGVFDADEAALDPTAVLESAAVRLFVERATAADPSFELDRATVESVVAICRQLDGVPLALELAAARTRSLDVADLAERLSERFRLLKGTRRGADPRHHTLLDTVKWSYDLLDTDDRHLFEQLSVFAGPFDLVAAEVVCDDRDGTIDVIDGLTRLVDRSMLGVRRSTAGTRYEMLETLRAYGADRLDDVGRIGLHGRHLGHYRHQAGRFGAGLETAEEQRWVAEVDAAFTNLRAAHRFAVDTGDHDAALEIVASLIEYSARSMRYEITGWGQSALDISDDDHPLRLLVAAFVVYGMFLRGDHEPAIDHARALLDQADGPTEPGYALALRAYLNAIFSLTEPELAMPVFAEHLALAEESGDTNRLVHSTYFNAVAHASMGLTDDAVALAERSSVAAAQSGNPTALASALFATGIATEASDIEASLGILERSEQVARAVGNRWMAAFALTESSSLHLRLGRRREACAGFAEVLDTWYRAGDWANQWLSLNQSAIAVADGGDLEWAAQMVGAIEAHSTLGALPMEPAQRQRLLDSVNQLRDGLGADRYDDLRRAGAALVIDDVVTGTRQALLALVD
ncbi:MAG: ATP-binding protein [Acidimicrobiales bacterium]